MILSTKGRYAVMAMVELSSNGMGPVSLGIIADRQGIPLAYLEQIFAKLKKADLVLSLRGPGGGYRLARPAKEIWVSDIVRAAEESIEMTRCGRAGDGCTTKKARCLTHDLWEGLTQQIDVYLSAFSLQDVCDGKVKEKIPNKAAAAIQSHING